MAQLQRSEIISEAIIEAGRKAENVNLIRSFDWVTKEMSREKALLVANATGSLGVNVNNMVLPSDFRSQRLIEVGGRWHRRFSAFKVADNWLRLIISPKDFYYYDQTVTGTPTIYTIEKSPSIGKVLYYPYTVAGGEAYELYYYAYHPKAWKTWAGLAAKTDISFTASSKTIAQAAAGFDVEACRAGRELTVSGSLSNDGTYTIVSATAAAVVVSEALSDEAAGETITITVQSENEYLHLYGENWDDVVIHGVAWRAARLIKEWDIAEKERGIFYNELDDMCAAVASTPRPKRVVYHHF